MTITKLLSDWSFGILMKPLKFGFSYLKSIDIQSHLVFYKTKPQILYSRS